MQINPFIDRINEQADGPSVAVYLPTPLATQLIELVGGEQIIPPPAKNARKWRFPDGYEVWTTEEAVRYALEVTPDILGDLIDEA